MKLLFDQNLSYKLCQRLADLFPGSTHVRLCGLDRADDVTVWAYAREHGYVVVTLDGDFADLAALTGSPPKAVWLRCGNQSTPAVEQILRRHAADLLRLDDEPVDCLEIFL